MYHRPYVLCTPAFEVQPHGFLRVGLYDELLDVLREHGQSLVLLGVGEAPGELDLLGVDHELVVAAATTDCTRR